MIPTADIKKIFAFVDAVNVLKFETRWGTDLKDLTKRDTTAAHSWRTALMAYLIASQFPFLNMGKVLKLALVHDVPEALVGDTPFVKVYAGHVKASDKIEAERVAMKRLADILPPVLGREAMEILEDYVSADSLEAKFVKIMDKIEAARHLLFMGADNVDYPAPAVEHAGKGRGWRPEFDSIIEYVRDEYRAHFAEKGIPWLPEYDLPAESKT